MAEVKTWRKFSSRLRSEREPGKPSGSPSTAQMCVSPCDDACVRVCVCVRVCAVTPPALHTDGTLKWRTRHAPVLVYHGGTTQIYTGYCPPTPPPPPPHTHTHTQCFWLVDCIFVQREQTHAKSWHNEHTRLTVVIYTHDAWSGLMQLCVHTLPVCVCVCVCTVNGNKWATTNAKCLPVCLICHNSLQSNTASISMCVHGACANA